jgi:tumor protein p53-inducible protein 3
MQAVLQDSYGDETTLYVGTCDIMEPSNGEILIKVYATALNRMDLLQCRGTYPVPPDASKIIGVEV